MEFNAEDKIEEFIAEIKLCMLLSNLYWIVWAIGSYENSEKIKFDYLEFAKLRFDVYLELKQKFLSEISNVYF